MIRIFTNLNFLFYLLPFERVISLHNELALISNTFFWFSFIGRHFCDEEVAFSIQNYTPMSPLLSTTSPKLMYIQIKIIAVPINKNICTVDVSHRRTFTSLYRGLSVRIF